MISSRSPVGRLVVLAVGVPLAVPGAVPAVPGRAAAAPPAVPAAVANLPDFELRRGPDRAAPLRALDGRLHRGGAGEVLGSSGQKKLRGGCGEAAAVPPGALVHCFNATDSAGANWIPQGVTTVSDAVDGERLPGGGRPILVSWHDGGRVRVTFADPDRRTYRHVLLVHPTMKGDKPTYTDIDVHAGGIAWYGDKLYVADTRHGLREFDTRHIYDLGKSKAGTTADTGRAGLHGGKYHGHGYRYVMPQTGSWRFVRGPTTRRCSGSGPVRMSWIAIDRTTWHHVLIGGEWCRPEDARGRIVTWPVRALSGTRPVQADWAETLPADRIQGAVRANGQWWFTQGRGEKRGRLLTARRDWWDWGRVTSGPASHGPEDLSCYRGQHRIWTVAEYPEKRALFGFSADSCR
ncbi:MAG: hypothetical protein FWJ90_22410 [Actinomadura sp.]